MKRAVMLVIVSIVLATVLVVAGCAGGRSQGDAPAQAIARRFLTALLQQNSAAIANASAVGDREGIQATAQAVQRFKSDAGTRTVEIEALADSQPRNSVFRYVLDDGDESLLVAIQLDPAQKRVLTAWFSAGP